MSNISIGFSRDWTTEFFDQRVAFLGTTIVDLQSQVVPLNDQPQWSTVVDQLKSQIAECDLKMEELGRLQKRYLSIDLDDYEQIGRDVDAKTNEVKSMLRKMQNGVTQFARFKEIDNPTVIQNVQINLADDVNTVAEKFKRQNKDYLLKLKQRTKKFDDCFSNGEDEGVYSFGFDEKQVGMLTESEELVNSRVEEIKKIAKTVQELAEMTRELNSLVHEQGTIVDRIDYNIQHTEKHVAKAVQEIKQAEKYQKATRVKIIVLILLLLIVGGVIVLVLKVAL
ncbi:syntaxin-16, putative [Entamoeba invadens IP1]|uniref:Syntaxin-16, putative n=1 Tax=Entamoeba invadens IP1 TaxID=370355 RepID=A0A0A1U292_ENTIV|nr:syntaxin-16, putative [Entamoeba invadens IP1]ELP88191.1 syntaxin-16, putative [Entamoeba invadens IP1]|eukprot:XP_004254962.1 syntaxin-16, putative [Entamoeba invadens IP1]